MKKCKLTSIFQDVLYNKFMDKKHFVYILETEHNTFYCGYTDDVEKRFKQHLEGRGAKYTRARRPCRLVYSKECDSKSSAMKLEYRIKQLSRKEKLDLILGVLKEF